MAPPKTDQTQNVRLDSWKSIAAFLGRDERTAKRWERERDMPVHRLPGGRGGVFAFTGELNEWMHRPEADVSPLASSEPLPPASGDGAARLADSAIAGGDPGPVTSEPPLVPERLGQAAWRKWAAIGLVAAGILGIGAWRLLRHRAAGQVQAGARQFSPDAMTNDLYLQGRYHWEKRTPEDLNKAVGYFKQAIARSPSFAPAYVGLADTYNLLREYASMPDSEAYPLALAAARKAIELDPSSAEAHKSLAFATFYWEWDTASAEREFRRAIELDPKCSVAHHWYATFLSAAGRPAEALHEIELAQQLDPASTSVLADKGFIEYSAGAKEEAKALLKQVEESAPNAASSHRYLANVYYDEGNFPQYFAERRKSAELTHNAGELMVVQAAEVGYAAGGKTRMLQGVLAAQERLYREGQLSAYELAATYAQLGRKKEALDYLEVAVRRHDPQLILVRGDGRLASLHNEQQYRDVVARMGFSGVA